MKLIDFIALGPIKIAPWNFIISNNKILNEIWDSSQRMIQK